MASQLVADGQQTYAAGARLHEAASAFHITPVSFFV